MNFIRTLISVFVVAVIGVCIAGQFWAGSADFTSTYRLGARVVLAICTVASIGCLWLLWREKPALDADGDHETSSSSVASA